jgi:uncharacterized protein (TIGR03435 family)
MSPLKIISAGFLLLGFTQVFAQTQKAMHSFEAVSIKPSAPMPAFFMPGTRLVCPLSGCGGPGTSDPGLMRFADITLRHLIETAYSVMAYQVQAPSWLDSGRFDVVATVPQGATRGLTMLMLQNLLADRFQLKLHHSTKELPVYMLVVAKGGPKLKESAPDSTADPGRDRARGTMWATDPSGARVTKFEFNGQNMAKFAEALTLQADRPIIDMTGLAGKYEIRLEFAPDISNPHSVPDLFTALTEQLGLKLESRKAPVDVLVVDSAAKQPSEN